LRLRYFRYSYNLDPQHGQRRRRRRRSVGGLRSYDRSLRFASLPDADSLLTRAQIGRSEVDRPTINYSRDKGLETRAARRRGNRSKFIVYDGLLDAGRQAPGHENNGYD